MPTPKAAPQKDGSVRYRVRFRDAYNRSSSRTFFDLSGAETFCAWIDEHGPAIALKMLGTLNDELTGDADVDTSPFLSVVAEEFFTWKQPYTRAERTVSEYRDAYAAHIRPTFGGRRVASISPADVEDWVEAMVTGKIARRTRRKSPKRDENGKIIEVKPKPLSPKTIRARHALLHAIMDYAANPRRGYIDANPCQGVNLPKQLKPTPKGLMPMQWQAIHANLVAAGEHDAADLAAFLIGSGWRLGEALALNVAGVEDYGEGRPMWVTMSRVLRRNPDGTHTIAEAEGKAQKSMRRIELDPATAAIVRARLAGKRHSDLVFTHNGHAWAPHNFRNRFTRACKSAGLENATIHWLRHTHVAWLAMSGAPLPELQKRIGHADITTTIGTYGGMIGDVGATTLGAFAAMRDAAPTVTSSSPTATIEGSTV